MEYISNDINKVFILGDQEPMFSEIESVNYFWVKVKEHHELGIFIEALGRVPLCDKILIQVLIDGPRVADLLSGVSKPPKSKLKYWFILMRCASETSFSRELFGIQREEDTKRKKENR